MGGPAADADEAGPERPRARERILLVIGSLHPGGAEKVVAQLATGLDRRRYDVRVACVREAGRIGDEVAAAGIGVTTLASAGGTSPYAAPWRLLGLVREFDPHVVHSHGIVALTVTGPLAYARLLPRWIHTFHYGNYPYASRRQMRLEAALCRPATELVCVGKAQRDAILRHHRLPLNRTLLIPNGVGANPHVDDRECRLRTRAGLGFSEGEFLVGSICVLSEQKGVSYLLEAAARMAPEAPQIRFLIVGSGPLEAELRRRAQDLGLSGKVRFTGWRSDVDELLVAIDAFVMPSLWEAMPLALLEAMAARRPMIVTSVGDNPELVGHGECGILVEPRDPEALADAIRTLWSNRALGGELGKRALLRFESRYSAARMLDAHERLYRARPARASLVRRLKFAAKSIANIHVGGADPDIFLFATPRSGSTWLMEILASQPGIKFYDEPLNPRRLGVAHGGRFPDFESLMPETGDPARIVAWLRDLQSGRHGYMNPTPLRPNHRFLTKRNVFKIHEIEHLVADVLRHCGGMPLYLLRHPVATSVSRRILPRLELFLKSQHYAGLVGDPERLAEVRRIAAGGDVLQRAVVSWCFENVEALRTPQTGSLVVTYEELVLNPGQSCDLLLDRLRLPDRQRMLAAFGRPATNFYMSDERTVSAMQESDAGAKRLRLVTKWQSQVTGSQLDGVDEVLALFGIDAYRPRRLLADPRYLHFADTRRLAAAASR